MFKEALYRFSQWKESPGGVLVLLILYVGIVVEEAMNGKVKT